MLSLKEGQDHLQLGPDIWGEQLQSTTPPICPTAHIGAAARIGQFASHKGARACREPYVTHVRGISAAGRQHSLQELQPPSIRHAGKPLRLDPVGAFSLDLARFVREQVRLHE